MRETRRLALAFVAGGRHDRAAPAAATPSSLPARATLVVHYGHDRGWTPMSDGYRITLDADDAGSIGPNASVTFADLASGDHAVGVDGLATNCEVTGGNPRTVVVPAADTIEVGFAVSCSFLPATVIVRTSTSGSAPDLDGYLVSVDGAPGHPVGTRDSLTLDGIRPGSHGFGLSDVSSNCTVAGANPIALTLEPGATDSLTFSVSCTGVSPAHLLFTGQVGDVSHVFERASDGSITDLTPDD